MPYYLSEKSLILMLLALVMALSAGDLSAQKKKRKKNKPNMSIEFKLSSIYDSNILKYSDKYLDLFMNNEDQGRFHIESSDDVVLHGALKLSSTYKILKKRKTRFNLDFNRRSYLVNEIKSWNSFGFGVQQDLSKKVTVKMFYSYIPEFYIRHFRDDDWTETYGYVPEAFQPYAFAKDNYGLYIQRELFKKTRVRFTLSNARYYHNQHFTEYDSNNYSYALKAWQTLHKKLKISLAYQYTTSDAKGYDGLNESKESSDDSDATFVEDGLYLGLNWTIPKVLKKYHNLNIDTRYMKRYFTTENYLEEDRIHAGRVDENIRFYVTYYIKLNKKLKLTCYYNWMLRNSTTNAVPNQVYLSNEKDYFQYQVGLGLSYKFNI